MFNHWEVIGLSNKQSNKQRDSGENIHLDLLSYAGGEELLYMAVLHHSRGVVILSQCYDTVCISSFVDDIIFSHKSITA